MSNEDLVELTKRTYLEHFAKSITTITSQMTTLTCSCGVVFDGTWDGVRDQHLEHQSRIIVRKILSAAAEGRPRWAGPERKAGSGAARTF